MRKHVIFVKENTRSYNTVLTVGFLVVIYEYIDFFLFLFPLYTRTRKILVLVGTT